MKSASHTFVYNLRHNREKNISRFLYGYQILYINFELPYLSSVFISIIDTSHQFIIVWKIIATQKVISKCDKNVRPCLNSYLYKLYLCKMICFLIYNTYKIPKIELVYYLKFFYHFFITICNFHTIIMIFYILLYCLSL